MIQRDFILIVGAYGTDDCPSPSPSVIGPFATHEDAEAAAQIVADYWKAPDAKHPYGVPYCEVRQLVTPIGHAVLYEAEGWIATEACEEYDYKYADDGACLTCGFTEDEHVVPEDEEDEDE